MDDAKKLWRWWQSLLAGYGEVFTRPGWVRLVQWVTGTVLCWEEHTITQILVSLGLESRWRSLEHFAEYGCWDREAVERVTQQLIDRDYPGPRWGRYRVVALDDTKEHRTSANVWGTCTMHESTARCPNRAETVRVHNWVVLGDLLPGPRWQFLPHTTRLYCRVGQLPAGEKFHKKTQLAVAMLRQADAASPTPVLAVFDGAYAVDTVVEPLLNPGLGQRCIDFVTRLRLDARLYAPLIRKPGTNGRPRTWGQRLPAPQYHGQWSAKWQKGKAVVYGRRRKFRCKKLCCYWAVSGPDQAIHAFVFEVEGYAKPWYIVTSALDLSPAQVVAAFAARFRQEDAFRDHKQRLGMEECRAWTKEPILRTFQVQMIAMTLLRLLQRRVDVAWGKGTWWLLPEWKPHKQHPSVLDLRRLLWRHRGSFSQFLLDLEEIEKVPATLPADRKLVARAA